MSDRPCHYDMLGLDRGVSAEEVKRAYRKLALSWHPDKNPGKREEATEMFRLISEAYEVLRDPEKRRRYDMHGHEGENAEVHAGGHSYHRGGAAAARGGNGGSWGGGPGGGTGMPFPPMPNPFEGFGNPFEGFHKGDLFSGFDPFDSFFPGGREGARSGQAGMRGGDRAPHNGGPAGDPFFTGGFMGNSFGGGSSFGGFGAGGGSFSSSSSSSGFGSGGVSTSTRSSTTVGPDGVSRTVSRTEKTVINPDGTRETQVEEFVDGVPVTPGQSLTEGEGGGRRGRGGDRAVANPHSERNRGGENVSRIFGSGRPY